MDQPTCIECGILFASPMDVARHRKQGCIQDKLEPPCKVAKPDFIALSDSSDSESEDESLWDDLLNKTFECHNKDFSKKVTAYESEGLSEKKARQRAYHDLKKAYRTTLMEKYGSFLKYLDSLRRSKLHHRVLDDLDVLAKKYGFDRAVAKTLKKHRGAFDVLIENADSDVSDESSSDEQSTENADSDESDEGSSDKENTETSSMDEYDAEIVDSSGQESQGEDTVDESKSDAETEGSQDD